MGQMTITEALAEIKTIGKRVGKKESFILEHIVGQSGLEDPLGTDGGSRMVIARERQAITDLHERVIRIRGAIHEANHSTEITVCDQNRTIADWLVWRREVATHAQSIMNSMHSKIHAARKQWQQQGGNVAGESATPNRFDLTILIDEAELAREREGIEEVLGSLDGLLSLKNATTMIEIG